MRNSYYKLDTTNYRSDSLEEKKKEKRGPDNQTLLRLLEEGEQLHSMFRCARIQVWREGGSKYNNNNIHIYYRD